MSTESKPITRVLVVDDSPLICKLLTAMIHTDPQLRVVGTAGNGREAIEMVWQLQPDLITMDVVMPVLDGLEATKQIMAYRPTPILIITSGVATQGMELVFKAMSYGALDVLDKASLNLGENQTSRVALLTERIKLLARVPVIHHPLARIEAHRHTHAQFAPRPAGHRIVAIAASTGGPPALALVLKTLPADLGCGVVIVQHIASGFDQGLVDWLDAESNWSVAVAERGVVIQAGYAYVAPAGFHMRVADGGTIHLDDEPECNGLKPSATVLFESVARVYGERAVAVILTGMGADGTAGLKHIKQARGYVIAQNEASSAVFGMPKAAIEAGVVDVVCPLTEIPGAIERALRRGQPVKTQP